jgi:pimeloyl-ACP methyl ester carboxylesterase
MNEATGAIAYSTGTVTSKDGTTIGYRQLGHGPGLVLVHGGMQAAQNFMKLASALSNEFTVHILNRRGRGSSGPFGDDYSIKKECEDLDALMKTTGSHYLFGLSSGALISLEAARVLPEISKVALYEPPLPVNDYSPAYWLDSYDAEIEKGDLGAALVTVLKGTKTSPVMSFVPRFVLVPLMRRAIKAADPSKVPAGDVHPLALVPTMHYDAQLVREMEGKLNQFSDVNIDVLLLGGSKSPKYLSDALGALSRVLPKCSRVELRGADHLAADNDGKPELVAEQLRSFFLGSRDLGVAAERRKG